MMLGKTLKNIYHKSKDGGSSVNLKMIMRTDAPLRSRQNLLNTIFERIIAEIIFIVAMYLFLTLQNWIIFKN